MPELIIAESTSALYDRMAGQMAQVARRAVAERGRFLCALAGGNTLRPLYERLREVPWRERFPWVQTEFFFTDEQGVAADAPHSNFRMVRESMLADVPIAEVQVHPMVDSPTGFEDQATRYARTLEQLVPAADGIPQLDLVLLELGTDGHIASLFAEGKSLNAGGKWCVAEELAAEGWRLSLTLPVLSNARETWVMACGASRRSIVARCIHPDPHGLPAQRLAFATTVHWWLDPAAAGDLG